MYRKQKLWCSQRERAVDYNFEIIGEKIYQQDDYNYLGILLNYNGNFYKARNKIVEQAQKSLYSLYTKIRNISIPLDLQLKLLMY